MLFAKIHRMHKFELQSYEMQVTTDFESHIVTP